MLIASANDPALQAYRNEILFHQTIDRYAAAWMHHKPFWYFVVEVIPPLWLPFTLFLPWVAPSWRDAVRTKDLRVVLPLLWVLAVVVFFSASPGKRGVYVLPALPVAVLAAAPALIAVLARTAVKRLVFALAVIVAVVPALAAIYLLFAPGTLDDIRATYGIAPIAPLVTMGAGGVVVCAWLRERAALLAFLGTLAVAFAIVGYWINPAIDASRSSVSFVRGVERAAQNVPELGLLAYREQFLLYFDRPTINFGHARWTEYGAEHDDASAWLSANSRRALLMRESDRARCFADADARYAASDGDERWVIVSGRPDPACIARGRLSAARRFEPLHATRPAN
jgi:4-amino-4-deoxy-L-arabinose transferase-like glycosyltransferase